MTTFPATSNVLTWHKGLSIIGDLTIIPPFFILAVLIDIIAYLILGVCWILRFIATAVLVCLGWLIIIMSKESFTNYSEVIEDAWGFTKELTEWEYY